MVVVDALAHLDGDRHGAVGAAPTAARTISPNSSRLPRQRRAAALAGHLGHRAAEVEVDVVGAGPPSTIIRTAVADDAGSTP